MLRGRFGDTTGRPYIEGRLLLPRLGLSADVSFLVDTGADATVLMPADVGQMGLDVGQLTNRSESVGVGGRSRQFVEPAAVMFLEDGRQLHAYFIDLRIAEGAELLRLPSLLGRDVLDRWRMVYDPQRAELTFRVRSADQRLRMRRR